MENNWQVFQITVDNKNNMNLIKEVCQDLSTTKWFYDSTISDAIEYFCHKHNVSLSKKEKKDCTVKIRKVFKN